MRIEWHPQAVEDLSGLAAADLRRIREAVGRLADTEDARQRLLPYTGTLKGFWKLRVGDYRLVCRIETRDEQVVLVIYVAHRSRVYGKRGEKIAKRRTGD